MQSSHEILRKLDSSVKKEFETNKRLLTFEEYLMVLTQNPERQCRGSGKYLLDAMDYFGKEPTHNPEVFKFKLFDIPSDGLVKRLIGNEWVQTSIYQSLKSFTRQGINNRLILLHGPNGSAKSTIVHSLMVGLERYSKTTEGSAYTLNWVFPAEKITKGEMGLKTSSSIKVEHYDSFALLPDEDIAARVNCDLKDHPFLLIPHDQRLPLLQDLLGESKASILWKSMPLYLREGDLCHRCRLIYDALLVSHHGDYKRVLQHIQIERFHFSRRYRKGLATIEPQMHVDAQYTQLTYNRSISSLPAVLQNLNLFSVSGDLVDGNRGMVEFSDLLKRPIDTFKYLLTASETNLVNIGSSTAFLDTVLFGSSNELQLDAFKEFPDFGSFKARLELIRVPYLLTVHQEEAVCNLFLEQFSGEKHVAPGVSYTLALWAVLTRLKKPNSIHYPPNIGSIISALTPLEKARLYDKEEMPHHLSADDRKILRSNIKKLREEYLNIPYYEGRIGASARELKSVLFDASQNADYPCLSPLAVIHALEEFIKRVSEHEFLKQDVKDGYHDVHEFVQVVKAVYLERVDREIRQSIGLYDSGQWNDFIKRYVLHLSHLLKKEKIQNPLTGKNEDPDLSLIKEFETICDAPKSESELMTFRQTIISQVGAWSLDNPKQALVYGQVFPQYFAKLEKHYYETQRGLLVKMQNALEITDHKNDDSLSEGAQLASRTIKNMVKNLSYCEKCAKEVIQFLMKKRP